jgi:hypothetical protein
MNMHVDVAEFAVQELARKRGLFGKLVLALRAMFSITKVEKGSWADGARGLQCCSDTIDRKSASRGAKAPLPQSISSL